VTWGFFFFLTLECACRGLLEAVHVMRRSEVHYLAVIACLWSALVVLTYGFLMCC